MYNKSEKINMTKNVIAILSRAANLAKSKMANILLENFKNSHDIMTNLHRIIRMVVLVSEIV